MSVSRTLSTWMNASGNLLVRLSQISSRKLICGSQKCSCTSLSSLFLVRDYSSLSNGDNCLVIKLKISRHILPTVGCLGRTHYMAKEFRNVSKLKEMDRHICQEALSPQVVSYCSAPATRILPGILIIFWLMTWLSWFTSLNETPAD